jgi:predicted nucleic acid-binding protein
MNIEEKLDKIITHLESSNQKKDSTNSKENDISTSIKEIQTQIDEVISIMVVGDTQESLQRKISTLEKTIQDNQSEQRPFLKIYYNTQSGSQINVHRRTAHLLEMNDLMERHTKVKKYPKDLQFMLHTLTKKKYDLLHQQNENNDSEVYM